jgi:hypothetical protein
MKVFMKELPHGKWVVYDDKGKLVIMSRDKKICLNYLNKLQTEKE